MSNLEILGFVAAFLTTTSFLPQAIRVIVTRDTSALSLLMYSMFTLGVALWLCYGYLREDRAVMIANLITFVLAAFILSIKIYTEFFANKPAVSDDTE